MPALPFQVLTLVTDLAIIIFILYYLFKFKAREKQLHDKETKVDTNYHQVVDDALSRERKIIDDATGQAGQIIDDAKHINQSVKDEVNQALQLMVLDIQKEAFTTAKNFTTEYQKSLQELATGSIEEFRTITKGLQLDLQKQVKEFHDILLPQLQKELDDYKKSRLAQTEVLVTQIAQKASQEIINKAFSLEDHKNLVIESLEKAKKQGAFD